MTSDQFIKGALAQRAFRDGSEHGGIDNMLAVAFVMRNRQRAGWQGGEWLEIISWADKVAGTYYAPGRMLNLRDVNVRLLLNQVDDIYSGIAVDPLTDGALFYAELNKLHNPWFQDTIVKKAEEHPRVAQIGNVVFFR